MAELPTPSVDEDEEDLAFGYYTIDSNYAVRFNVKLVA
jgi:hypothetical protein